MTAGTPYVGFFDVKVNDAEQLAIVASIDDSAINSSVDRALVVVQTAGGAYVSTDVRWKESDVLPGQTEAVRTSGRPLTRRPSTTRVDSSTSRT